MLKEETDRVSTLAAGLAALGARVEATPDGLTVGGRDRLCGGLVSSHGCYTFSIS